MNEELFAYRVWPDGTVQDWDERPYGCMSDDCLRVMARDEEEAHAIANPTAGRSPGATRDYKAKYES